MSGFSDYEHYDALGLADLVRQRKVSLDESEWRVYCSGQRQHINMSITAATNSAGLMQRGDRADARSEGRRHRNGKPFKYQVAFLPPQRKPRDE